MRVLLDECLPTALRHDFLDHDVRTVRYMGWSGLTNGELLEQMKSHEFEVFVTIDQNVQFQQNLPSHGIAAIIIAAPSNRYEVILPLVPRIQSALDRVRPGELVFIEG
jgi:hypothetical protein